MHCGALFNFGFHAQTFIHIIIILSALRQRNPHQAELPD